MVERDGSVCGEPVMVGKVCYDHAVLHPIFTDEPMCPLTCSDEEFDHYNHGRLLQGRLIMLRGSWS